MKKKYIILSGVSIILLLIFFNYNKIINFSLPIVKSSIQKQLNILDDPQTEFNISTDFKSKKIILKVINPYFKNIEKLSNGSADYILIEKSFNSIFSDNIDKIFINKLDFKYSIEESKLLDKSNTSLKKTLSNQLSITKKTNFLVITESNINVEYLSKKNKIFIKDLKIDNINNKLTSKGYILDQDKKNNFEILSSNINESIDVKIILDSYSTNFLSNFYQNPIYDLLIFNTYKGFINLKIKDYFNDFILSYNLSSLDNQISASGKYSYKQELHKSVINVDNVLLDDYVNQFKIFEKIKNVNIGKYDITFKIDKGFNKINLHAIGIDNKIELNGLLVNYSLENLIIKGNKIKISDHFSNINNLIDFIPNWISDTFILENSFNFDMVFNSNINTLDMTLKDNYENKIKLKFDTKKKFIEKLQFHLFEDKVNKFIIDINDYYIEAQINKDFTDYITSNFYENFSKDLSLDIFLDYEQIIFKGKIHDFIYNKFSEINNIEDLFDNFNLEIKNAVVRYEEIELLKNITDMEGPIDIFYEQNNKINQKNVFLDLKNIEFEINRIKYIKKPYEKLNVSFELTNNNSNKNELLVEKFKIDGKNTLIEGSVFLIDNTIRNIEFNSFRFLKNDISLNLESNLYNPYNVNKNIKIRIRGNELDLSFLDIKKTKSQLRNINIDLDINVEKFYYINNTNFNKADLIGKFNNVWQSLKFNGIFEEGGELSINLRPQNNKRHFNIISSNSGKALKIKKISKSIIGGDLNFKGEYDSINDDNNFDANLSLKNFALKKESKIAKFIKFIRIFDIKKQLAGDTEDFEYAEMKIQKRDKYYEIINGKAYGGLMALTLGGHINKNNESVNIEGMVAPTHAIDSWIGNIPIVGSILTGFEGGSVVAANYSVKGTVKNPKYFVNPLSILTPGVFKDFWKIFKPLENQEE